MLLVGRLYLGLSGIVADAAKDCRKIDRRGRAIVLREQLGGRNTVEGIEITDATLVIFQIFNAPLIK